MFCDTGIFCPYQSRTLIGEGVLIFNEPNFNAVHLPYLVVAVIPGLNASHRPNHIRTVFHPFKYPSAAQMYIPGLLRKSGAGCRGSVVSGKYAAKRMAFRQGGIDVNMTNQTEQFMSFGQSPVVKQECSEGIHL